MSGQGPSEDSRNIYNTVNFENWSATPCITKYLFVCFNVFQLRSNTPVLQSFICTTVNLSVKTGDVVYELETSNGNPI